MRFRTLVKLVAVFQATLFSQFAHSKPPSKPTATSHPNVVVVLTDDQGWGDLSLHGNSNLATPRIDSLARDGVQFDRFYVCAVCSPTRAEFLTGRYHARSGVFSTSAGGERMNLDETTIADCFLKAGYRTGAFGKWHNGMQYPYHPNGRGFEEYYGFCSGHWGDYFSPPLEHNGKLVQGKGFCIDDFTDHALEFMKKSIDDHEPFFAYLPFNTPHSPMQVPDRYWERFQNKQLALHHREPEKEELDHVRCALAMCENIDWNVGRILDHLEQWEVADNTIVIYFCDNGPNGFRWNGDMKGRKGSTDEGGVRSPLLIRWPSNIEAGRTILPIASVTDLLPTLCELCSVPRIGAKPLDGKSLVPLLTDSADAAHWGDREIINHWKGRCSVRNQRFRLGSQDGLFDIPQDPGQRVDVSEQFPAMKERLSRTRQRFLKEVDGYDRDQRPFLVGHSDFRFTQVPARDAVATGNIQRSNRFPNCSYFSNWTSIADKIEWEVEVLETGLYQVELQYTCAIEDVGCELELSFGDSSLTIPIREAHDPPVRGMEHDRFERVESYVKDFKSLNAGLIELKAGTGKLQLSATKIPGNQAIDFRVLMLTRQ